MKLTIIGIFDRKAQTFISMEPTPNVAVATRTLQEIVNKPSEQNNIAKWPEDFELWELGTFDTETGWLDPTTDEDGVHAKKMIVLAAALKANHSA